MKTTEQILVEKYGALMTLSQVAELLNRSADGLRMTLRGESELSQQLRPARRKLGRRLYFKTQMISAALNGDGEAQ